MSVQLFAARLNRGLSVPALSAEADVPEHVIRHAENGGRPRPENALKLATALGVQVTDLWPVPEQDAA